MSNSFTSASGSSTASGVSSGLTTLSGLILVTPYNQIGIQNQSNGPIANSTPSSIQNAPIQGLPVLSFAPTSLLFNYEGENVVELEADITDHYTEQNSVFNDQIALRPEIIRTNGFIGELNDISPLANTIINQILSKLTTISAYAPGLSTAALTILNQAVLAYEVGNSLVASAQQSLNSLSGSSSTITVNGVTIPVASQTKQQFYFTQFYQYYLQRTFFKVQTPWAIFNNCVIKSLRVIQPADSVSVSTFEVTFKRMYISGLVTTNGTSGRLAAQSSTPTTSGPQQLTTGAAAYVPGQASVVQ